MRLIFKQPDVLFFLAIFSLSAAIILGFPQDIRFDQQLIRYVFSFKDFPSFDDGVISHLIAGFYNRFVAPSAESLNQHFRFLAMTGFLTSAFLLCRLVVRDWRLRCIFLAFLMLSRLPFLWLSTELFTATAFCVALIGMLENWKPHWLALALVMLANTKPDLILVATALLGYAVFFEPSHKRQRLRLVSCFIGFEVLLWIPGFIANGNQFFGNRGFMAFAQHYSDLVYPHQAAAQAADPWLQPEKYMERIFPKAQSIRDLVLHYPVKYFDFLTLSLGKGFKNLIRLFGFLALLFPMRIAFLNRMPLTRFEKIVGITLVGFVPFFLLSYPHVRYMTRYYPAFVILLAAWTERLPDPKKGKTHIKRYAYATMAMALAFQAFLFFRDLHALSFGGYFWFPD
ncbi:MAG: hypothetical protein AB1540_00905 [Bdellovibrionota bacterium]